MNGQLIHEVQHEPRRPVEITREHPDIVVIEGIRYDADYFRQISHPDTDVLYAVRRDGDNVWLTTICNAEEARRFFDEINGQGEPAVEEQDHAL